MAGFTSYGRRSGHQALRPETALISRARASCRAGPTGVARDRADQGKNKPSTNRRPRHRDSDSRTKRVEFLCRQAYWPSGLSFVVVLRSFPAPAEKRTTVQSRAQSSSESATCRIAQPPPSFVARAGCRQAWSPKPCLPLERPCPNAGLGRRDRGQTGSESATRRFARFGGRKATAIGRWPKPSQIMAPKGLRRAARLNPSSPP